MCDILLIIVGQFGFSRIKLYAYTLRVNFSCIRISKQQFAHEYDIIRKKEYAISCKLSVTLLF